MMRPIACAALALLAGCAATPPSVPQTITVTKIVYVPWVMPAYLKVCADDPAPLPVPRIAATDPRAGSQVAHYIAALRTHDASALGVADDCRATLAAAVQAAAAQAK